MKKDFEKVKKYIKIAASVAVFAMTVYTLIPKSEKIKGIDTNSLEHFTPELQGQEEAVAPEAAE